jgi:DNA-binding transcriptional LysR family regulator
VLTDHSPAASSVVARKLGQMAFAIYAAGDYAAAEPRAFLDARYHACAWVGFTPAHRYFATEQWLALRRPIGPPAHRFDNAFMVLEAVRAGIGLGLLPVWLGAHDSSLVRVSEVLLDLIHPTSYLMNADLRHEPRLRAVVDAIAALFRRERRNLLGEAIQP